MSGIFSCFLIGSESHLIRCAEILLDRGHGIVGLHTPNPTIAAWARVQRIPLADTLDDVAGIVGDQQLDYLFSITNLAILPPVLLALPAKLAINFHDGPLPRFAGVNAPAWAILEGESTFGITWHVMEPRVDRGDILKEEPLTIAADETALTLNTKCFEAAVSTFEELIQDLESDDVERSPPTADGFRAFRKSHRPSAAGVIAPESEAAEIERLVRGLDFGPYTNPLATPKLWVDGRFYIVRRAEIREDLEGAAPGAVLKTESDSVFVATATDPVVLSGLLTIDGAPLSDTGGLSRSPDTPLRLDDDARGRITATTERTAPNESFWVARLRDLETPKLAVRGDGEVAAPAAISLEVPTSLDAAGPEAVMAAFLAFAARMTASAPFDAGFSPASLREMVGQFDTLYANTVPVRFEYAPESTLHEHADRFAVVRAAREERGTYARDVVARYPDLRDLRSRAPAFYEFGLVEGSDSDVPSTLASRVNLVRDAEGWVLRFRADGMTAADAAALHHRFEVFLENLAADPTVALGDVSLLTRAETDVLLQPAAAVAKPFPRDDRVHDGFERTAAARPDSVAVVCGNEQITYEDLNRRANRLAHALREAGVEPDTRVGLCVDRTVDMVVGLLGVLKAGGAYVPLDPAYPDDRLALVISDSQMSLAVTQSHLTDQLPLDVRTICMDTDDLGDRPDQDPGGGASSHHLAYVIYTSGSTGTPKGVMVEHRNVVNFFAGMDDRVPHHPPGRWLAVTSLSFDISVLELLWTVSRGFTVILRQGDEHEPHRAAASTGSGRRMDFSLFYFAADEGAETRGRDKYRLLTEGAEYADTHDFVAVWTPERHFHAFGGLYPNPSVAGAALAALTERVAIRAGSCVLPLHHPVRVVEEWSLVDNLSDGRVGIAFASGWQPTDFVLRPENHPERKAVLSRDLEVVRRLWRGDTVDFPGPTGRPVSVRTLPRPVQPDLPVWITTAGSVETFITAARAGANVLTHLLGQTVDQIAEKVAAYRAAWGEAGHDGAGTVTLMLHTFVGDDDDAVRETVREPMKRYLRTAMSLVRDAAWEFPTFKKMNVDSKATLDQMVDGLPDADMDALLDFAFERYYSTSGLFGTAERCLALVDRLKEIGVDEIACLIDFGVPTDDALSHLDALDEVRRRANAGPQIGTDGGADDIATLIAQHDVTHLQCTPALARLMLADPPTREALAGVRMMLVGGEALPDSLAADLVDAVGGDVTNMYGPTETTIWSATWSVTPNTKVSLGDPIANTSLYVLDERRRPRPPGVPGELYIGGEGVARGYFERPDLTAERFVPDPFEPDGPGRLYRTGDLVVRHDDGTLEFLGRIDHQVKLRGYRIELGEIEAALRAHEDVRDAVVLLREDLPGDARLVAYYVPEPHIGANPRSLNQNARTPGRNDPRPLPNLTARLGTTLPDFMIPSVFIPMDQFPLTPNGKLDRNALPTPTGGQRRAARKVEPPSNDVERVIAEIWSDVLQVPEVGVLDDFFELGGHSLLVIQVLNRLRDTSVGDVALTDLFRYPTVRALAARVSS